MDFRGVDFRVDICMDFRMDFWWILNRFLVQFFLIEMLTLRVEKHEQIQNPPEIYLQFLDAFSLSFHCSLFLVSPWLGQGVNQGAGGKGIGRGTIPKSCMALDPSASLHPQMRMWIGWCPEGRICWSRAALTLPARLLGPSNTQSVCKKDNPF